MKAAKRAVA